MKRVLLIVACVSLPLALTGCDVLNYIWQHIIGRSYAQVDLSSLENVAGNMTGSRIGQVSLPINTVVGYRTRNGNLGKLSVISTPGADLRFQFTTYNVTDGSVLAASPGGGLSVGSNSSCDLETGMQLPGPAAGDFLWRSDEVLVPQGAAAFYVFP
jgi:hypothetical protein